MGKVRMMHCSQIVFGRGQKPKNCKYVELVQYSVLCQSFFVLGSFFFLLNLTVVSVQ